jgi:hypothetical protein
MFAPVAVCYFTWFSTFVLGILYAHGQTWVGRDFGWLFQLSRWPFPFSIQDVTDMLMLLAVLAVLPLRFARSRRDEERLAAEMESARTVQQVLIPTDHGSDIFNNYVSSGSQHFDSDQYDGRVDANLFTSYHVFARYTLADLTTTRRRLLAISPAALLRSASRVIRSIAIRALRSEWIIHSALVCRRMCVSGSIAIAFGFSPTE